MHPARSGRPFDEVGTRFRALEGQVALSSPSESLGRPTRRLVRVPVQEMDSSAPNSSGAWRRISKPSKVNSRTVPFSAPFSRRKSNPYGMALLSMPRATSPASWTATKSLFRIFSFRQSPAIISFRCSLVIEPLLNHFQWVSHLILVNDFSKESRFRSSCLRSLSMSTLSGRLIWFRLHAHG